MSARSGLWANHADSSLYGFDERIVNLDEAVNRAAERYGELPKLRTVFPKGQST